MEWGGRNLMDWKSEPPTDGQLTYIKTMNKELKWTIDWPNTKGAAYKIIEKMKRELDIRKSLKI